jgi:sulfate permease, SulP family
MKTLLSRLGLNYREYIPKSYVCWKEGYTREIIIHDLLAGFTVGIIALPLALAFALGSGVSPEKGIYTAIVAGFLISLLGGSRVQIGGPTGAYIAIIAPIVELHGYEGLAIATLMAGVMLIFMGIARCGFFLRYVPHSVTTGFTSGLGLIIFSNQIKDFFGLDIPNIPTDFVEKWWLYFQCCHTFSTWAVVISVVSLIIIFGLRKWNPKIPGTILVVALATLLVYLFDIPVDTIEKKYNELPRTLPIPTIPRTTFDQIQVMFPSAFAIALLGAIESLLSAVVADRMTGNGHRSNCELVAQGIGNIGSVLFGGIPATGAIARTGANIRMGAKTPLAGIFHAVTLLLLMLFFAPYAAKIPFCVLGAVLIFVAWGMSDIEHFWSILKGPVADWIVLLVTFFVTIFIDLVNAVIVGVALAAILAIFPRESRQPKPAPPA